VKCIPVANVDKESEHKENTSEHKSEHLSEPVSSLNLLIIQPKTDLNKNYSCDKCGTKFTAKTSMYRHKRKICNVVNENKLDDIVIHR
jgi:formylmethanofuran dehydrogenase subunit E